MIKFKKYMKSGARVKSALFFLLLGLFVTDDQVSAAVIFSNGGEGYSIGQILPNPNFCAVDCGSASSAAGRAENASSCDPAVSAPAGSRCLRWDVAQDQHDNYNEIGKFGTVMSEGSTLVLAFRQNLNRIGGVDIWSESTDSADKGLGLHGQDSSDFRWDLGMGNWGSQVANQNHKWTVWAGNPSNHFNPELEDYDTYVQNVAPYSALNPIQLDYDRWYNLVLELKLADNSPENGFVKLYVNGTKVLEYLNIQTTDTFSGSNIVFDYIEFGGTLCQPGYNCPPHIRYYDDLLVATSLADTSSYMSDPEAGGDTTPPAAPTGLGVQ